MDLHAIDGDADATPTTDLPTATMISGPGATNAAVSGPPFPEDTAIVLSHLANLIDSSLRIRGTNLSIRDWAAALLGIDPTTVAVTTEAPGPLEAQLTAIAFAAELAQHPPVAVVGYDREEPPDWVKLDLGETSLRVPARLAAWYPAGTLILPPVVVQVTKPWQSPSLQFAVYSKPEHAGAAEAYLEVLRDKSRTQSNPFKHRVLETVATQAGLTYRVISLPPTTRADVVLPERIWRDVDRNVGGLFRALPRLRAAGLSVNRGVLLAGPPGTGKTALCRAIANELDDGTRTIVFCSSQAIREHIRELYQQLKDLAPALVVMEDVDLVIGDRHGSSSASLLDFLVALDGATSDHEGVVTIATTNDPGSIDAAAKRSARFDVLIEVPTPDQAGRVAILRRYLAEADRAGQVDVAMVARFTAGLSGADLRELVSDALLQAVTDDPAADAESVHVSTELLVRLAVERRPRVHIGMYV